MLPVSRSCLVATTLALMLCGALTPVFAAPPPKSANLLLNPGFEETIKGHPWMAAAWDTFQSGLNTVFFGRDTFMVHSGRYSVSVANVSLLVPMWYNWSQTLLVGKEAWGKDAVFTVWSRNNGVQGRGYILLQAYRDTVEKMARTWKVPRDSAAVRLGITPTGNPYVNLGWKRQYFSDEETDWVKREVRVYVPPSTNILIVRGGLLGTGQMIFDDASLTLEPAQPAPPVAMNTNLLADPGFEGDGNQWEYSMPPYENMKIERDTLVAHSGKASIRYSGGHSGMVQTRAGVCQIIANRDLSGKRLRLSGWVKTDSLQGGLAYIKVYCTTLDGDVHDTTPGQFGATTEWTKTTMEVDAPPGTFQVAGWFLYNAPAQGYVYYDDCSLEVIGEANYIKDNTPPPRPQPLPGR